MREIEVPEISACDDDECLCVREKERDKKKQVMGEDNVAELAIEKEREEKEKK